MRIGLVGAQLAHWSGGNDFLRICAGGLWQRQSELAIDFALLLSQDTPIQVLRRHLYPWKCVAHDLLKLRRPAFSRVPVLPAKMAIAAIGSFGGDLKTLTYRERKGSCENLNKLLRKRHFDVAFPITSYYSELTVPWIGYIPDLQHRHRPELFSAEEYSSREAQFNSLLAEAKSIIVNSVDTKNDIEQTYPEYRGRIFNLPFAPILNPEWLSVDKSETITRYRLPKRYFLISNQFWAHKAHATAFEALAQLEPAYSDVAIVCTGNTTDYRHPNYFRELQLNVVKLKLKERIQILGLIPKIDQIQLMRGAVAVVQPTLFEGGPGGGSVYDAVCTGTPAILSDIPINREIESSITVLRFFEKANAANLAQKMRDALQSRPERPSNDELLRQSLVHAKALGSRLLEACEYACTTEARQ